MLQLTSEEQTWLDAYREAHEQEASWDSSRNAHIRIESPWTSARRKRCGYYSYRQERRENALRAAETLTRDGLYADAISRAYYAILHAAKAALRVHDMVAESHPAVRRMNQAVKRNRSRFPEDFMFQLTSEESDSLRSHFVTLKTGRGRHRKYLPFAFTEQGVAMLSSVLRSKRAVQVNIEIMRAFVRLRQMLASNTQLATKLVDMEKKYDAQFKVVFDAIRQLMTPPQSKKRKIGFVVEEKAAAYGRR